MARFFLSSIFARLVGEVFPWGTVIVNITGCLAIGVLATVTGPDGRLAIPPDIRQFLLVGICGGYTTFSSFSLQTLTLVRAGDYLGAGGNAAISFVACMMGVWAGAILGNFVNQVRVG